MHEERIVWLKEDVSTILILGIFSTVRHQLTLFKNSLTYFTITVGSHLKM